MYEDLMEQAVDDANADRALAAVVRNRGAAGVDGMTTDRLKSHLKRHWGKIRAKLLAGTYTPSPVRRVERPKTNGGVRLLGIPTVLDRFVQQLLLQAMTPIYEPLFSEHSYGFRPGRSAHDAVRAALRHVLEGRDWVVDLDIAKFFDRVCHDILMARIGKTIRDRRALRLIGKYLRAGVMVEGVVVREERGTPQGGPLSPLLANIYLDALDRELERRGHRFVRYADDCNIYVAGPAAADRLVRQLPEWIRKHLRLEVNAAKSGAGRPWERKFLGFRITKDGRIEVSPESLARFKNRVRELWHSCRSLTSNQLRDQWMAYLRGWWNYYRLADWAPSGPGLGRLDSTAHPEDLLAALAQLEREAGPASAPGVFAPFGAVGQQQPGGVADGQARRHANRAGQRHPPPLRTVDAVRSCKPGRVTPTAGY